MITIITGKPRIGKTSLMTSLAVPLMGPDGIEDTLRMQDLIRDMNKTGYSFTVPEHPVFANYTIDCPFYDTTSYYINPFYLGFKNKKHPTMFVPMGSHIFIMEGQEVFNSRESTRFPDHLSRYIEKHGHFDLNIYIDCQRAGLIDLNVRELSERIIEIENRTIKTDKYGFIKRMIWHCVEFNNINDHTQYLATGALGRGFKTDYVYEGDIHDCYDSEGCFLMFLNGWESKDFHLKKSKHYGLDPASSIEFNKTHSYEVPKTFYKK